MKVLGELHEVDTWGRSGGVLVELDQDEFSALTRICPMGHEGHRVFPKELMTALADLDLFRRVLQEALHLLPKPAVPS